MIRLIALAGIATYALCAGVDVIQAIGFTWSELPYFLPKIGYLAAWKIMGTSLAPLGVELMRCASGVLVAVQSAEVSNV